MTENIQAAIKEADRVSKKQKICAAKTSDSINNLIDELTAAKHRIAAEGSTDTILADLNKRLGQLNTVHTISEQTKELHSTVNKLSKVQINGLPISFACSLRLQGMIPTSMHAAAGD